MRLMLLSLVLFTGAVLADASSDCYAIKDKDKQRYCLASVKGEPSRCYLIQNRDEQRLCLAETKGRRSTCFSIKDRDTQRLCLAKVPH